MNLKNNRSEGWPPAVHPTSLAYEWLPMCSYIWNKAVLVANVISCVCICVCLYVCADVCVCMCLCVCMQMCVCVWVRTKCACVCMRACICVCVCVEAVRGWEWHGISMYSILQGLVVCKRLSIKHSSLISVRPRVSVHKYIKGCTVWRLTGLKWLA